ncbi:hypothetical protein AL755_19810 [Arthrobacter sp. ERGS1:01]|uniref:hypothetical protein n=1 Tax=Arthrobacter sp. ERGS1:01 TaxID=1704044 RepID=UPI0006B42163|nr:hypothetical protein [Arthrobacter sp. ERGS1:01]ALE07199.1 hypothetical protein AL755_19810 [Arthrobacter sp. ERGS1:01]
MTEIGAWTEETEIPVCVPPRRPRKSQDVVVTVWPTYLDSFERDWTHAETVQVLELYDQGVDLYSLEEICGLEVEQIVTRLIRLIFGIQGSLGDENAVANSGKPYSPQGQEMLRTGWRNGESLDVLAARLGRTPLGAGWKMLALGIPAVSAELRSEYFLT